MESLATQVASTLGELRDLLDDIGVTDQERESRESELSKALSERLRDHLRSVTAEKNKLYEEAKRIVKGIREMEFSLLDDKANVVYPPEDKEIYIPLTRCLETLNERHKTVMNTHRKRYEQVKDFVAVLVSYSCFLEQSFVQVALPPTSGYASLPSNFDLSPSYLSALDQEYTRVREEYDRRVGLVRDTAEEIVNLWAELGTPQIQQDEGLINNYCESTEQLGLHEADIVRLQSKKAKLLDEKHKRKRKLEELKFAVESLWDRLGIEEYDRKEFRAETRGCGLRDINKFEAELDRLNELKRQNLHLFVEDARIKLQELWDTLYFSEEEMLDFTPAFSDVYSDALLSAHERQISKLEVLKEQRLPILQLIEKHRSLVKDQDELSASSQDASRLMLKPAKGEKRDPGKLLREEKMRKRIAKELPKVLAELRKVLESWEAEYSRPFLVHGERYLDDLAISETTSRPPPSRSKTPVSGTTTLKAKAAQASSRQGSVIRAPPRSGAKTPVVPPKRPQIPASSGLLSSSKPVSPSKIPARVPLGTMKSGNNSPERRPRQPQSTAYETGISRKMAPPPRVPPPKMREFVPVRSQQPTPPDSENWRCGSSASADSGPIRQVSPEDVYDEREHMSFVPSTFPGSRTNQSDHLTNLQPSGARSNYLTNRPTCGEARIISNTSSSSQAISGSENWETYDDASDPEPDASNTYYAKLKAARGKRATPEGGYPSPRVPNSKKLRSIYDNQMPVQSYIEENGRMVPAGSDAGWTDEDAF